MKYQKVLNWTKNEHNKELVVKSFIALIARTAGAGSAFVMNIVIARYIGASESGYFFLAITVMTLIATIGRLGTDNVALRYVSIYHENAEWEQMNGITVTILKYVWIITSAIAIIICFFAKDISIFLFHKEKLEWPLFWTSISIPFFAIANIYGMALQGVKKVLISITTLKIAAPVFLVALIFVFAPTNSIQTSIFFLFSNIFAVALGFYWWRKNSPARNTKYDFSKLWKSCYALWTGDIMQQVVIWGGQFVSGIYNTPVELAQLSVARNTSVLITFILTAINYVSAPRFATLYHQGKLEQLKRYARNTTWLMILIATPFFLLLWIFPENIMLLFGKGFGGNIWLLRILALGQLINVITGSVGYLLIMSGHEKDIMKIRIVSGVAAIVLAFILNPIYGVIGSAIATSIALAASNLLALGYVKKRLGFSTLAIFGFFK